MSEKKPDPREWDFRNVQPTKLPGRTPDANVIPTGPSAPWKPPPADE